MWKTSAGAWEGMERLIKNFPRDDHQAGTHTTRRNDYRNRVDAKLSSAKL